LGLPHGAQKWVEGEDDLLAMGVARLKPDWARVASMYLPGKTKRQVRLGRIM
jgi:hypothetical protein